MERDADSRGWERMERKGMNNHDREEALGPIAQILLRDGEPARLVADLG